MSRLTSFLSRISSHLIRYQTVWAPLSMIMVVLIAISTSSIHYQGDIEEYILMSAAIAEHGTPDIRPSDVSHIATRLPLMKPSMDLIAQGMNQHDIVPKAGFYQSIHGQYFAIHFFAYSALAALPFKLFEMGGVNPLKAFLLVNLLSVCLLAWSAKVFFGDWIKASVCIIVWMLCGGLNYLYWLGPEVMCAAFLTAATFLYLCERRIFASCLVGFAALQNPPIVFALGFLPLLKWVVDYRVDQSIFNNLRTLFRLAFRPITIVAALLGAAIFSSAVLFNLWAFETPNIIMKIATIPSLMGGVRLFSFFFDLNQGMLIGLCGVWGAILISLMKPSVNRKEWFIFALIIAFSLCLAAPALTTGNWHSGGMGMMRYAFWAGMPFFVFLVYCWRERKPGLSEFGIFIVIQMALTVSAFVNLKPHFNLVSHQILRHAPSLYNPEPELFVELNAQRDGEEMRVDQVYTFIDRGLVRKRMFHVYNQSIEQQICGAGSQLKAGQRTVEAGFGWRYLNGAVTCEERKTITADDFNKEEHIKFVSGWSRLELPGGDWSGRWSDGPDSSLLVLVPQACEEIVVSLSGHYYGSNRRSLVRINDQNMGWHNLSDVARFTLKCPTDGKLDIHLQHEAPGQTTPTEEYPQGRRLAFFLNTVQIVQSRVAGFPSP